MSANLPAGTRNAAEVSRKEVATQPIKTAPMDRSFPIVGRATFTEDNMKGEENAEIDTAINATVLLTPAFVPSAMSFKSPGANERIIASP
jgi:hypothetical protein